MLLSLVLTLTPKEETALPANLGRAAQALLLRWVAEADPQMAERLHEEEGNKPFTCSSLVGGRGRGGKTMTVRPDEEYWLRFTSLEEELSQRLLEVRAHPPAMVELDRAIFRVVGLTPDREAHAWAGCARYEDLAAPYLLGKARPDHRLGLEFASPTAFRSKDMNVPLPRPDLVFGSLLDKWNAFSPVALSPEVRRFASECLAISRYHLKTRALPFKEGALQVGCVGQCHYVALNRDRYWLNVLNLLADFALYAGVGYQTTAGMGQARRVGEGER